MKVRRLLMISFVLLAVVAVIAVAVLIVSTVSAQGAEDHPDMRQERVLQANNWSRPARERAGEISLQRSPAG